MVSIISDLKDYLSDNFDNYATIQTDVLTDDSESICLRIDPSNLVENRFMDGSRKGRTIFSIYGKSTSKSTAINQLWTYINGLDLFEFPLTDNACITTIPSTEPHFISENENKEFIYVASFEMEYIYQN